MNEDQQPVTIEELADIVRQLMGVVGSHNDFITGATNEKRVKGAMKRAYGSANDEDRRNLGPALDYLSNKNREHFSGRGFDTDYADDNFDREFQDLAIRAIDAGANPLAAVMAAARQYGFKPEEAQAVAVEATQDAVAHKQDEAAQGQTGAAAAGAEDQPPAVAQQGADMPDDGTEAGIPAADGGAVEAAQAAQRPQGSGVSVKKGYDDYTNDEIDEMARRDPAKYAALISSK